MEELKKIDEFERFKKFVWLYVFEKLLTDISFLMFYKNKNKLAQYEFVSIWNLLKYLLLILIILLYVSDNILITFVLCYQISYKHISSIFNAKINLSWRFSGIILAFILIVKFWNATLLIYLTLNKYMAEKYIGLWV